MSTLISRVVHVSTRMTLTGIRIADDDTYYRFVEPVTLDAGRYRAELDPATHTATITEEASA